MRLLVLALAGVITVATVDTIRSVGRPSPRRAGGPRSTRAASARGEFVNYSRALERIGPQRPTVRAVESSADRAFSGHANGRGGDGSRAR